MRQTKRKLKVLELLAHSQPSGISLLNEIRCKYLDTADASEGVGGRPDRRKSFTRTVLGNFDNLDIRYLADKRYTYGELTGGLFARWAVWELLDQKYLTGLPRPEEITVAVGRDACAAFAVFDQQLAVIGPATFMKDIVILGNRNIEQQDLDDLSKIPWKICCFTENGTTNDPYFPVNEMARLPHYIEFSEKKTVATARKRLLYR